MKELCVLYTEETARLLRLTPVLNHFLWRGEALNAAPPVRRLSGWFGSMMSALCCGENFPDPRQFSGKRWEWELMNQFKTDLNSVLSRDSLQTIYMVINSLFFSPFSESHGKAKEQVHSAAIVITLKDDK